MNYLAKTNKPNFLRAKDGKLPATKIGKCYYYTQMANRAVEASIAQRRFSFVGKRKSIKKEYVLTKERNFTLLLSLA